MVSIVAAADVPAAALADCYAATHAASPHFAAYGITGAVLRQYARFIADEARRWPWNYVAADGAGRVLGMYLLVPSGSLADSDALPPPARAHRQLYLRIRDEVRARRYGAPEEGRVLVCTILGFRPEHQGKGLAKLVMERTNDAARAAGYERWWVFSVNPNTAKAVGGGVDQRVRLMSRAAGALFRLPCWVQNRVLMPAAYLAGAVPADFVMFSVPVACSPQMAAAGLPNIVVSNQPLRGARKGRDEAKRPPAAPPALAGTHQQQQAGRALGRSLVAARPKL